MLRLTFLCLALAVSLGAAGCAGPMIGPGCGSSCNDCDGTGYGHSRATGPFSQMSQWRKSLTCGSGCGETYIGEWISTPPDCADPCCGNQFVGGAVKARPFCWQRGSFFRNGIFGGLYGKRFLRRQFIVW